MANQYDDDDTFDSDTDDVSSDGPANLRKALKRAEKEKKELLEQLAQLHRGQREQTVNSLLESKGVPAKVAKFIPGDLTTPEQIEGWLNENGDVFGYQPQDAQTQADKSENAAAIQRINAATHNANTPSRNADTVAAITGAKSKEELDMLVFGQTLNRRR